MIVDDPICMAAVCIIYRCRLHKMLVPAADCIHVSAYADGQQVYESMRHLHIVCIYCTCIIRLYICVETCRETMAFWECWCKLVPLAASRAGLWEVGVVQVRGQLPASSQQLPGSFTVLPLL